MAPSRCMSRSMAPCSWICFLSFSVLFPLHLFVAPLAVALATGTGCRSAVEYGPVSDGDCEHVLPVSARVPCCYGCPEESVSAEGQSWGMISWSKSEKVRLTIR